MVRVVGSEWLLNFMGLKKGCSFTSIDFYRVPSLYNGEHVQPPGSQLLVKGTLKVSLQQKAKYHENE